MATAEKTTGKIYPDFCSNFASFVFLLLFMDRMIDKVECNSKRVEEPQAKCGGL